jgi:hypothetical protein
MIVIGCAIANRILFAIFKRRARLDMSAMASWAAFMPISLRFISQPQVSVF